MGNLRSSHQLYSPHVYRVRVTFSHSTMALSDIIDTIIADAHTHADTLKAEARATVKRITEDADRRRAESDNHNAQKIKDALARNKTRAGAKARHESQNRIGMAKQDILQSVIRETQQNIASLSDTDYAKLLLPYLLQVDALLASQNMSTDTTIYTPAKREQALKHVLSGTKVLKHARITSSDALTLGCRIETSTRAYNLSLTDMITETTREHADRLTHVLFPKNAQEN